MTQPTQSDGAAVPVTPGAVRGQPRVWLGVEAVAVLAVAVAAYAAGGHAWWLFAAMFLVPDVSFAAYAAGPAVGAVAYNVAHSYAVPVAVGAILHAAGLSVAVPLIWVAHIGFDRTFGYGLKYATGFGDTHLGRLGGGGRARSRAVG